MSYKTVLQMPSLAFAIISEGSSSESSGSKKRKQKYQKQAAAVWNYSRQIWIERNRKDIWRIYHNSPAFSSVAPWKTKLRILKWCLRCCLADYFAAWVEDSDLPDERPSVRGWWEKGKSEPWWWSSDESGKTREKSSAYLLHQDSDAWCSRCSAPRSL